MKRVKNSKRKLNKKQKRLIAILFAILLLVSVMYTFSKYVFEMEDMHIQGANEFYFKSDVLETEEKTYTLNDWDGASTYSLEISLMNYEDSLRTTESDLKYTISATTEGDATIKLSQENGTLTGNKQLADTIKITITPNSTIENYIEVNVIAKSTSPYEKNLSAKFKINVKTTKDYEAQVYDEGEYEYLYINSNDFSGNIDIAYDSSKLILDTNNEDLDGITISTTTSTTESGTVNQNVFEFTVKSGLHYKIGFIKKDKSASIELGTDIILN